MGLKESKMTTVLSRDGKAKPFDQGRIEAAIGKAFAAVSASGTADAVGGLGPEKIASDVARQVLSRAAGTIGLEEIQDLVEARLVYYRLYDQAKAYMLYRSRQQELREMTLAALDIEKTMDGYLGRSDWRVKENANVNYSLGGLILHNSGSITAKYWLKQIYSARVARAHESAAIHIHDLSMFSGYCAGWSLRQLIMEGLGGVKDKISSAPARHLHTLVQQMVNFLGIMQNEWAGAQAFSSFDTYLAPFVRRDGLDFRGVKQAIQSFIYGVNTPSRWGSQAPFTNITLDWVVPPDLAEQPALLAGEAQDFLYGDCQAEMDLINQAFLELMIEGDANGRGFQYPIPTYNITRDFAWDSPNAELLFSMTAKYGTPYFQNFVNSDLNPGDVRSMCCRLQLDKRELRKRGGGLFGSDEFTGSIGVVTINLPQIAFLASSWEDFYQRLENLMDIAKESLETKRRLVEQLLDQGLFPYTKRYLQHLDNHFSTIGIVGMNEALLNFDGSSLLMPEGRERALEILDFMREGLKTYQEESGHLYNLEASPAEGTSYRLALHDTKNLPGIRTAGTPEVPYYTNSSHLPVNATEDPFEALELQDPLQTKYTGGTVFHTFLGEAMADWRACRSLVRTIASRFRLPYFTLSPTYSICEHHGYHSGEHSTCPVCEGPTEIYSRIVGYYRSLCNWNQGKSQEFEERKTYLSSLPLRGDSPPSGKQEQGPGEAQQSGLDRRSPSESLLLFTTSSCPRCPAARQMLADSGREYRLVDAGSQEGSRLAAEWGISAVPTLVLVDGRKGGEIARGSELEAMRILLKEAGSVRA